MCAHQNCGKLIYETFVKDYIVFLHAVKDKLLSILQTVLKSKTLKKMSKKTYDPRLVWPYSLLLCGRTGCGKTMWIVELLKSHKVFKTIKEIRAPRRCEFVEGFPEDLMS